MKFNRKLSVGTLALAISLGGLTLGSQAAYAGDGHATKTKSSKKARGGKNGCGSTAKKKDMNKKDAKADAKAKKGEKGAAMSCGGGSKSCG